MIKILYCFCLIYLYYPVIGDKNDCASTYIILAPKQIRPGFDYRVAAFVENFTEPLDVNLVIQKDGCNIAYSKITLEEGKHQEANLQLPSNATNGHYEFLAFGSSSSGKFSILNKTDLHFQEKSKSIFIQTDKGIYKTGQLVRYRIFILNAEMKPLQTSFSGYIEDPSSNRIKLFKNIAVDNGVYSGEFQLSDQPPLGTWTITVEVNNQKATKSFSVQEYVLPKFEVNVSLPPYVLMSDKELTATVKASYTFGKPILGKVKFLFEGTGFNSLLVITYARLQNGEAKAHLNMRDLLSSQNFADKLDFTVTAVVTEDITGMVQNGTSTVTLYREKIQLNVIKSSQFFKPGLKYLLYIKVTMPNNKPIPKNLKNLLSVRFSSQYVDNIDNENITYYEVPENGMVTAEYYPQENFDYIYAKIKYGKVETTETIQKFNSPTNNHLELIVKTDYPKVGDKIDFQVNSTTPLTSLNYVVISHGTIVTSNKLTLNNEMTAEFSIEATSAMSPTARVLIYHARGELSPDALDVKVDGAIQNNVSLLMEPEVKSNNDYAEPGQHITVRGQAAPNSFIGLAAVDQSVLLLSTGNDITNNDILKEMDSYNKNFYEPDDHKAMVFGRDGNKPVNGKDSAEVFEHCGMIVFTNSYIYSDEPRPYYMKTGGHRFKAQMTSAMAAPEVMNDISMDSEEKTSYSFGGAASGQKEIKPRKYFPETWLWLDINASSDGSFSNTTIVPDSITTWVANAISLDSNLGLGVSTVPAKLRVFRPFFVSANLPFSIIRGETFTMQVLVFNYLQDNLDVVVSLEKSNYFTIANSSEDSGFSQNLKVMSGKPVPVNIVITPVVVGEIDIIVSAKSARAGDIEKKKLLVKPEGVTLYFNSPIFADLSNSNSFTDKVDCQLPLENIVDGSQRAEVSAIVDILGPTINHLESLVRMPYGCGEQNMINFVPDVIAAKYLTAIDQFTGALKEKTLNYIQNGYQRQLTYQRHDGSFSAFGSRDDEGSTWLTAFVLKSFHQAKPFTYIDEVIFKKGLHWLGKQLTPENYFEERGKIIDHHIQGGVTGKVALTAYVIIAIAEIGELMENTKSINFSLSYLEKELDSLTSPFEVAIVSYALAKCNSTLADKAFEKLNSLAIKEDNVVHWSNPNDKKPKKFSPYKSTGESLQATGYALLTIMMRKDINRAFPIVKWLISQMSNLGGFQSTQDTVIGLEALAAFAEQTHTKNTEMAVTFSAEEFSQNLDLRSSESLLWQNIQIPKFPKSVDIKASGKGTAFLQVSWKVNVKATSDTDYFDLDISTNTTFLGFSVTACPVQKNEAIIGMFVMEITMPSGYSADSSLFSQILDEHPEIGRIEGKNDDTNVYIYYNMINNEPTNCVTIDANRVHIIENLKEVPIVLYAYYQPEKRITKMYKTPEVTEVAVPNENNSEVCQAQCLQTCQ